jgi:hypothetical protein
MLEVILKRDLDRVIAGVARVFGGVKLGAGGLARAYGGGVAKALDAATVVDVPDRSASRSRRRSPRSIPCCALLAEPGVEHAPPEFDAAGVVVRGTVLASEADASRWRSPPPPGAGRRGPGRPLRPRRHPEVSGSSCG